METILERTENGQFSATFNGETKTFVTIRGALKWLGKVSK